MPRTKKSSTEQLVFKNGEFVYERKEYTKTYDELLRKWIKSKPEVSYIPISEKGLCKKVILKAIVRRSAFDSHLKPIYALFLRTFEFTIPNDEASKHHYVSFWNSHVFYHELEHTSSQELSFNSELCHSIGRERKITEAKAKELLESKECHPYLLQEFGNSLSTVI